MRDIRFRAWHKEQKLMYTVHAIYPSLHIVLMQSGDMLFSGSDNEMELMQFTGLLDKNGKEIYEGDIVAGRNAPDYVKSIVRIGEAETEVDFGEYSLSKPYYGVYLEGSSDLEERLLKGEMSVLGNIYENPELLDTSQAM